MAFNLFSMPLNFIKNEVDIPLSNKSNNITTEVKEFKPRDDSFIKIKSEFPADSTISFLNNEKRQIDCALKNSQPQVTDMKNLKQKNGLKSKGLGENEVLCHPTVKNNKRKSKRNYVDYDGMTCSTESSGYVQWCAPTSSHQPDLMNHLVNGGSSSSSNQYENQNCSQREVVCYNDDPMMPTLSKSKQKKLRRKMRREIESTGGDVADRKPIKGQSSKKKKKKPSKNGATTTTPRNNAAQVSKNKKNTKKTHLEAHRNTTANNSGSLLPPHDQIHSFSMNDSSSLGFGNTFSFGNGHNFGSFANPVSNGVKFDRNQLKRKCPEDDNNERAAKMRKIYEEYDPLVLFSEKKLVEAEEEKCKPLPVKNANKNQPLSKTQLKKIEKSRNFREKQKEREARQADHQQGIQRTVVHCKFYIAGKCQKGSECTFSHDVEQERKDQVCKFYLMSTCNKPGSCLYLHGEWPCKFYHSRKGCRNENCKFSHEPLTDVTRKWLEKAREECEAAEAKTDVKEPPVNPVSTAMYQNSTVMYHNTFMSDSTNEGSSPMMYQRSESAQLFMSLEPELCDPVNVPFKLIPIDLNGGCVSLRSHFQSVIDRHIAEVTSVHESPKVKPLFAPCELPGCNDAKSDDRQAPGSTPSLASLFRVPLTSSHEQDQKHFITPHIDTTEQQARTFSNTSPYSDLPESTDGYLKIEGEPEMVHHPKNPSLPLFQMPLNPLYTRSSPVTDSQMPDIKPPISSLFQLPLITTSETPKITSSYEASTSSLFQAPLITAMHTLTSPASYTPKTTSLFQVPLVPASDGLTSPASNTPKTTSLFQDPLVPASDTPKTTSLFQVPASDTPKTTSLFQVPLVPASNALTSPASDTQKTTSQFQVPLVPTSDTPKTTSLFQVPLVPASDTPKTTSLFQDPLVPTSDTPKTTSLFQVPLVPASDTPKTTSLFQVPLTSPASDTRKTTSLFQVPLTSPASDTPKTTSLFQVPLVPASDTPKTTSLFQVPLVPSCAQGSTSHSARVTPDPAPSISSLFQAPLVVGASSFKSPSVSECEPQISPVSGQSVDDSSFSTKGQARHTLHAICLKPPSRNVQRN